VAPALGLLGPGGSMLVPAAMLLVAWGLARTLPCPAVSPAAGPPEQRRGEPGRGRTSRVAVIVALSTAYYFVYGPFETASPPYVRTHLEGGEGTYSLLWALFGLGALISLPLAPRLARRRPGVVNAVGAVAWGVLMLPVVVLESVPLVAGLFLLGGLVWGPYTTVETTALQRWVPPQRHGAVFGLQRSLLTTAAPLGAALSALLLEHLQPETVLGLSAGGCVLAGLAALASRDLRAAR
jgi:predicted MFS family arabinose efflux permease